VRNSESVSLHWISFFISGDKSKPLLFLSSLLPDPTTNVNSIYLNQVKTKPFKIFLESSSSKMVMPKELTPKGPALQES
jgi:hypothetical protein